MSARDDGADHTSGFTLVEAVVALAILGVALLLEVGAQWQSRLALEGLAVESALLMHAEATIESVRAGVQPLETGAVDLWLSAPGGEPVAGEEQVLLVRPTVVSETMVSGLCRLTVEARAEDRRGRPHAVTLETLVWKPGSLCGVEEE